jgi:lipopolysaccharide transport system ATP-binding protein
VLEAPQPVESFVLVVCIYFRDTRAATQVFCPSGRLGLDGFSGSTVVDVDFDPLRLGESEYMASIGLFKTCDFTTPREDEAYCVVDRAVMFKVYQSPTMAKSLGSFAHPVVWRHGDVSAFYDPTEH